MVHTNGYDIKFQLKQNALLSIVYKTLKINIKNTGAHDSTSLSFPEAELFATLFFGIDLSHPVGRAD
uniref:Ribosomal protein L5 n=1 Tax=Panagrolaimus sp. PS1159 TaxID=55785 RepID=A0AC35GU00_9BILA